MFSGDTIGKYRLVSRLGRGGMGEVWLAKATGHGGFVKTVVVKTLLPQFACDPLFIEMLAHEARICAKLSHPNLIEVFDFIEHGGIYLLAMEHVVGRPLQHVMKAAHARQWEIPAWFALRIAWDCCRGLECAHDEGIVHCDLSPSNVMVTFTGITKILDFGVAHSCARGPKADALKGKLAYMSPERIKSRATDRRTDIYALGVMLYLLFTGTLPFTADTDAELLHKIVTQTPRPPSELCDIDPRVEQLVLRAMQRDPGARHQSAGEVMAELSPCLDGLLSAYGQQEMAAYVRRLFETKDANYGLRELPPITQLLRLGSNGESSVIDTSEVAELDSLDIEVDSFARLDESSVLEVPHERPAPLATPHHTVFAYASGVHETRTTVQSLFGSERPSFSSDHSKIFDRPVARDALASTHDAAHSVFGDPSSSRSSSRSAEPAGWPWPTSRSKSD